MADHFCKRCRRLQSFRRFLSRYHSLYERGRGEAGYRRKFFQPVAFTVNWYALDSTETLGTKASSVKTQKPVKTEKTAKLDYAWWGGLKTADSTYQQFLTVAESSAVFTKGLYELSVTWDDAVRVYVDGKRVIDQWKQGRQRFDEAPNKKHRVSLGGKHTIRVEHAELGGFATLSLKIVKAGTR
ncbi:MAG: hypothetical protein EOO14_05890 [Chitinophagaceae bacterium]|nr:MAG: hypothetical protein EOO14_05890 [Chitinophagaceae bacterium]